MNSNSCELLAVVRRGDWDESLHFGIAALLDPSGTVVQSIGASAEPILPRSTLKPMFAATMLQLGLECSDQQLALVAASNSRSSFHIRIAEGFATALGLEESDLGCPPMAPRAGGEPRKFAHMCVGKHIAMASTARTFESDLDKLDPEHPLQQRLLADLEVVCGEQSTGTTIDGCGAPVHGLSLEALGRGFWSLGTRNPDLDEQHADALLRVGAAMRGNPEVVQGEGLPDTVISQRTGSIVKFGAEAVFAVVAPDGATAVCKIADGGTRAAPLVALTLLEQHGSLPEGTVESMCKELGLEVLGGTEVIGAIEARLPLLS
ncbi:asparaginase [Humidisolicoccus flavus]|uniref:asparaginase n=1 Tax=Humidisolicoccus flavus TaxID=3111414 RepID=UPI00324337FB